MRGMKLISCVVGLSMVGAAVSTAPAIAQNESDTSGTNVSNQTNVLFGFQPLSYIPAVDTSLRGTLGSLVSLTGGPGQNGVATATQDALNSLANGGRGNSAQGDGAQGQTDRDGTTGQEGTLGLVGSSSDRDNRTGGDSADISPETRAALAELAERLQEIERGRWAYGNALDRSIQASAKGLSRDLAQAATDCKAGRNKNFNTKISGCSRLNRLAKKISTFTQSLETLGKTMEQTVQKARIY